MDALAELPYQSSHSDGGVFVARIPKVLHEHINTAFPANVTLVGTVLPNGFAQISPRGSTMVYDDEHLALWERGTGSTNENLTDGSKEISHQNLTYSIAEEKVIANPTEQNNERVRITINPKTVQKPKPQ